MNNRRYNVKDFVIDQIKPQLEDIEEYLEIEFDEENFETLNGYLISKLQHIPDKKEKFEYSFGGYTFKVLSVENKVIKQILITKNIDESTQQIDAEADTSEE